MTSWMNMLYRNVKVLCTEGFDDVPDSVPAQWTLPSSRPLLDCALEAHAHVSTGVEDTVHITLIADDTLCLHKRWVKVRGEGLWRAGLGAGG